MCARRFLGCVFVLILLFVAAGFAIYQWGGDVLLKQAVPKGHFEAAAAGGGPDYAGHRAGSRGPGCADDPSHWLPDGVTRRASGDAAVFYIHPTTYLERDRWNAPLDDAGDTAFRTSCSSRARRARSTAPGKSGRPDTARPRYGAFLLKSEDAQKALDLAYGDVAAAFDRFVEGSRRQADHPRRPQPGRAPPRAAAERERSPASRSRSASVAAYVVGWPISTTADLPALGLPACACADQTGCILSWMSFGEPANPDLILKEWSKTKGLNGGERRQADVLCVNPISGTSDGAAQRRGQSGNAGADRGPAFRRRSQPGIGRRALRQGPADPRRRDPAARAVRAARQQLSRL